MHIYSLRLTRTKRNRVWADKCRRLICQCQTPLQYNKTLDSARLDMLLSENQRATQSVSVHGREKNSSIQFEFKWWLDALSRVVHKLKNCQKRVQFVLFCVVALSFFYFLFLFVRWQKFLLITITSNFENWHLKWMWWKSFFEI